MQLSVQAHQTFVPKETTTSIGKGSVSTEALKASHGQWEYTLYMQMLPIIYMKRIAV